MKVAKKKKIKEKKKKELVQEEYSIKQVIITVLIVCAIFVLFYFITTIFVKPNNNLNNTHTETETNKITMGQLLNRKQNEYYVLATKKSLYKEIYSDMDYQGLYNSYIENYESKEDALNIYYVDLDDALNKNFYDSDKLNITDDLSKLVVNDEVLFKIKDGKIEKTYVGSEKILDKLSRL